jgi:hypothetical protein
MQRVAVVPAAVLVGVICVALGCSAPRNPRPAADGFARGQAHRIIKGSVDRVWHDAMLALGDEGLRIEAADRESGSIACRRTYTAGGRNLIRQVRRIAELGTRHRRLRSVSEYSIRYTLFLAPAGEDTSLKIVAEIEATDRSSSMIIGPGIRQVIPLRLTLPSRGVAERRLFRRIASRLFSAEEMLYYVGDLGYE